MGNDATIMEIPVSDHREEEASGHLIAPEQSAEMRSRWEGIQAGFVDEPRECVKQADRLVSDAIRSLSETFARERENLEHQWSQGGDVSTEDLRQALRRYRTFFQRLLAV
jgi:hypothetical protein